MRGTRVVSHVLFMRPRQHPPGFSLIELLLTLAIVALIMGLTFPLYASLTKRAAFATCAGNLRTMHTGLSAYMLDHEMVWPQVNSASFMQNHEEFEAWVKILKPYGVSEQRWVCPGDEDSRKDFKAGARESDMTGSYVVTQFDEFPNTAFRWSQPWVLEMGAYHGDSKGPNTLMPDGSIQQAANLFIAR